MKPDFFGGHCERSATISRGLSLRAQRNHLAASHCERSEAISKAAGSPGTTDVPRERSVPSVHTPRVLRRSITAGDFLKGPRPADPGRKSPSRPPSVYRWQVLPAHSGDKPGAGRTPADGPAAKAAQGAAVAGDATADRPSRRRGRYPASKRRGRRRTSPTAAGEAGAALPPDSVAVAAKLSPRSRFRYRPCRPGR